MRRQIFFCLSLCIVALPALGSEPRAEINGPSSALLGAPVLLDVSGSVSDPEYPLQVQVAGGEDTASLKLWYDVNAKPGLAVLNVSRPGSYTVVVVAIGKTDGSDKTVTRVAAWPVTVETITPAPKPPEPGPGPGPGPPDPVPGPVTGKLWGVLVLPDLPSPTQSALRSSATLRSAFATKDTFLRSYLLSEAEIQSAAWKTALGNAGKLPAVLWIAENGKVLKTTSGATEASILTDLKSLRGGN